MIEYCIGRVRTKLESFSKTKFKAMNVLEFVKKYLKVQLYQ